MIKYVVLTRVATDLVHYWMAKKKDLIRSLEYVLLEGTICSTQQYIAGSCQGFSSPKRQFG